MKDGVAGGGGERPCMCYFHPREEVVGVCSQCLRERLLLLLASKTSPAAAHLLADRPLHRKNSSISLPKVFALGSSFLQRLDSSRHHLRPAPHDSDANSDADTASIASLDDSFISIKFEDNGKATWDSQKAAAGEKKTDTTTTAVVEHVKRGGVTRWRKQVVGRLLQLARWKRSGNGKAAACHQLGIDGKKTAERSSSKGTTVRGRGRGRSWIRTLTITRRPPAMPLS
ncbi:uncharacterized LOC4337497 [Oryza sativa Japonica Group]|uniref:Os04g0690500 protein n=4 Tax=Oryza TaxID=4527 RepID=B9FDR0_ORYSJ|nr:uncharacterized LOC4337497 [Oryza sativa Japonica Group]KAB8097642.1 hypothetical protein EE612_026423 [Oryza sativa]EEE61961.1 hypothetical protein OsJ_16729 [Oryza sativa Japonica Group]KAB8097643.1 hypothetical protein EE612_026423 [Oryza sativa]KAF2936679.1 hypothetical protein DAI22_04g320000 [Oryza sativa Japonica Group]KAF2936680.1 hypothetical protein DAI22_04g320000 [Oryza sativa Japonica Group]|eukprot:NP_001054352.1 Os04g0690500 [Oryza sativa Japonica Group]